MLSLRYIVITPVRNEEAHLRRTIESVGCQTIQPYRWVIVDDGSSDQTAMIADDAARQHNWIQVVHRADRGCRRPGGGVVEAFYDGYRLIEHEPWDFLVKLDGDLSFGPDYFEACFQRFAQAGGLGIGGGTVCVNAADGLQVESRGDPPFHVRGATKVYRRACWEAIGGLLRESGWDTIDEVKANMLGWSTRTFRDLSVVQHKLTGSADGNWRNWYKNGRANYIAGYHPAFMLLKCVKRIGEKPVVAASVALWAGFLSGYLQRVPHVPDKQLIHYLRQQQINRLLFRKSIWSC